MGSPSALTERLDDFPVVSLRVRLERRGPYVSRGPGLEEKFRQRFVGGNIENENRIKRSLSHIEALHLAPQFLQLLLGSLEALGRILNGANTLVGPVNQRHVGRHKAPPLMNAP